jgi:membrane associated rhomboid family serine protease
MRSRFPSASGISYSFGPGPLTPAIKVLIIANVIAFVIDFLAPSAGLTRAFGLSPRDVLTRLHVWQPLTYMFLHASFTHILFNMLGLWMFGVELERMWGTRFFTKYYFVCGVGAAATTLLVSLLPGTIGTQLFNSLTIGASGAIFGVMLAYALYFPYRPVYIFGVYPLPARWFVIIWGGISLLLSMSGNSGVAATAHVGGLLVGYVYLKGTRVHLISEIQYRYLKWRINRMRRKFDVYSGGRADDVDRRVH